MAWNNMYGLPPIRREFRKTYRCNSISFLGDKPEIEHSGKIVLPASALEELQRMEIQYPMMFRITKRSRHPSSRQASTHCGVAEFTADQGKVNLPFWIMENLGIGEGDLVEIENAQPRKATFIKLKPQSVDFLDITDPKAVLERSLTGFTASHSSEHGLQGFSCITKGDMLSIKYNDTIYRLLVEECKPDDAVSIIEADVNLDFSTPVGYVDPSIKYREEQEAEKKKAEQEKLEEEKRLLETPLGFRGVGFRLDGKKKDKAGVNGLVQALVIPKTARDLAEEARSLPFDRGMLTFPRAVDLPLPVDVKPEDNGFKAFAGDGNKLRTRKSKSKGK